jgi:hypothetical protein
MSAPVWSSGYKPTKEDLNAAAELRRLHEVNHELLEALVNLRDFAVMSNNRQVEYLDAGNKHPVEVAQAAIAKAIGDI